MYENFYVLIRNLQSKKEFSEVVLPKEKKLKISDSILPEIQHTKNNYRDLVKLVQYFNGKVPKSPFNSENISGIYELSRSDILDQANAYKLLKNVINKWLGEEIVPFRILGEEDDEDLIAEILKMGETGVLEVKKSLSLYEGIGETISAFANTRGGKVLIGFEEIDKASDKYDKDMILCKDFIIIGLDQNKFSLDDQRKRLAMHLNDAGIEVENLLIDTSLSVRGRRVCIIEVPNLSSSKPVFYKSEMYKRIDAQNKRMGSKEVLETVSKNYEV
jgi:hypothetical protein